MIKAHEVAEAVGGNSAARAALVSFAGEGTASPEAFADVCATVGRALLYQDDNERYAEYVSMLMREALDPDALLEAIYEGDPVAVLGEYVAVLGVEEYCDWERDHVDGLLDAEMDRRMDAARGN